tara:strand:+ start:151 stop:315 length:165 start_codon:yes stop_codon:yes gene_type:complete
MTYTLCYALFYSFHSADSVGKDILIDKFWIVQLAFSSDLAMCMAFSVGIIQLGF